MEILIKEFEVYHFDGCFYTQEELDTMGIKLYNFEMLSEVAKDKNANEYEVMEVESVGKEGNIFSLDSILKYLEKRSEDKFCFIDYGDKGDILYFNKYYGVSYHDEYFISSDSTTRDNVIIGINNAIGEKIRKHSCDHLSEITNEFYRQTELKQKKKRLIDSVTNK